MLAPRTPAAPAKATAAPTLRPAQPFMPPVRRAVAATTAAPAAARARAQAAPPAGPAQSLLAAVPAMLAPAVDALAHVARQQVPYRLLAQALGHDPLTGRAVAAAPQALAHTLLGLLPDGEARYQQLQAAGPALAQLPAWLGQQLAAHQLSGARLTQVLAETWATLKALGWRDLLDLGGAVQRLARPWVALARDVASFVAQSEGALLRWLVRAVLGEAPAAPVLKALDRGGDLLLRILRHPLPFLQHLVSAGQRGFANFLKNGPRHLLASVQDWLLGGLAKAGLHRPAQLDLAGVIDVLLQLFDLTKAAVLGRLRRRLAQVIGADNMDRLEEVIARVGGVALALFQRGPAAAWQAISEQAGDLKTQALDFVQQQVLSMATRAVPVFLATLAVPGGAFVQVAKGIYSGVMTFVEKGKQIAQVGTALLGSVSAIAAGQVAPAAQAVETTLVKVLPVALSFLAKWLGLDGISGAIRDGLKKVQAPVEKAVTRVLDVVTEKAKAVWGAGKAGAGKVVDKGRQVATAVGTQVKGWLGIREEFTLPNKEKHTLFFTEQQQLTLASTPQAYLTFLNGLRPKLAHAGLDLQKKYQQAVDLAAQIRVLEKSTQPGTPLTDSIRNKVKGLAFLTSDLMQLEASGMPVAEDSQPTYAGMNKEKFGLGMHMHYLSYNAVQGGLTNPSGTKPYKYGANDNYDALNQRRMPDAASSYYVRGHLLSEKLNGPGKDPQNIVPLSRIGNTSHEVEVEKDLKAAAGTIRGGQNRAFSYSVVPRYGRPAVPALEQEAKNLTTHTDRAVVAKANAWVRILRLEASVPIALVCTFREIDPITRQPVKGGFYRFHEVDNPIEQTRESYVQSSGLPHLNISGKHPQVKINSGFRPSQLIDLGFHPTDARELADQGRIFKSEQELLDFTPVVDKAAWQMKVRAKLNSKELRLS